jgi:hypothetical protein
MQQRILADATVQANLPQFCGNGPQLQVKNTFIDEVPKSRDEQPESLGLVRSQSAPELFSNVKARSIDDVTSIIDDKPFADEFRARSDTNCSDSSDEDDSACSMDGSEIFGQKTPTKDVLAECMDQKVGMDDSTSTFQPFFWPANHYYPSSPTYAQNQFFGYGDLQFVPWQGNSTVEPQYKEPRLHASPQLQHMSHEGSFSWSPQLVWDEVATPQLQPISVRKTPTGGYQFVWHADGRKLKTNDKQIVSPPFHLWLGDRKVTFKMIIYPSAQFDGKGGASFRSAAGQGRISLKCESDVSTALARISFSLAIGSLGKPSPLLEPQQSTHNFSQSAIWSLGETWDMASVVDPKSDTFSVCLHMVPAQ